MESDSVKFVREGLLCSYGSILCIWGMCCNMFMEHESCIAWHMTTLSAAFFLHETRCSGTVTWLDLTGAECNLCLVSCVWKEHSTWLCTATHLHQEVLKHMSNMWFILRDRTSCTSMTHFLAIFMPTETPIWSPIWSPCVWLNWKPIHSSTTANRATLPTLVTWLQIATPTPFLVTITPPFFVSTDICLPLSQHA